MRVGPRVWLATWIALATTSTALAHGPAPSPLEVLTLDATGVRAAMVRTSIGLAVDHPPDAWTYTCPSQWGDHELARAASDGQTVLMVGGGVLYRSTDGACHFEAIEMVEGSHALDAIAWAGRFWAPATLDASDDGGGLLVIDPQGAAALARQWEGEDAFRCDTLRGWTDGLVAAGASPTPTLWHASGDGHDLEWSKEPLPDLPPDASYLDVRAISAEGDIWLVAATESGRELWRGQSGAWARHGAPATALHGPVQVAGQWAVVRDGVLQILDEQGTWTPLEEVPWTCLQQVGDVPIACTLTTALRLAAIDESGATTHVLFEMAKLLPPRQGCPSDVDEAAACESDWIHFGAEAGLLDPSALSTPSTGASTSSGCGASPSESSARSTWWALLLTLLLVSRAGLHPGRTPVRRGLAWRGGRRRAD